MSSSDRSRQRPPIRGTRRRYRRLRPRGDRSPRWSHRARTRQRGPPRYARGSSSSARCFRLNGHLRPRSPEVVMSYYVGRSKTRARCGSSREGAHKCRKHRNDEPFTIACITQAIAPARSRRRHLDETSEDGRTQDNGTGRMAAVGGPQVDDRMAAAGQHEEESRRRTAPGGWPHRVRGLRRDGRQQQGGHIRKDQEPPRRGDRVPPQGEARGDTRNRQIRGIERLSKERRVEILPIGRRLGGCNTDNQALMFPSPWPGQEIMNPPIRLLL